MKKRLLISMICFLILMGMALLSSCGETDAKTESMEQVYKLAVEQEGFQGTYDDFLEYLRGDSAYEVAVKNGYVGTETEWLNSLQGTDGMDGTNAKLSARDLYDTAVADGFTGTYLDFVQTYLGTSGSEDNVSSNALFGSVSIYCKFTEYTSTSIFDMYRWGSQSQTSVATAAGSGVIYQINKENGSCYIITNYHVVYNNNSTTGIAEEIYVYLYGSEILGKEIYTEEQYGANAPSYYGMYMPAKYVGGSMSYDIAVLYVEDSDLLKNSNACAVTFADSNDIEVSETAYAVGNPEGDGISVTKGVVSVDSENLSMYAADEKTYTTFRVIRIDTAVNSGNSGGGLFNKNGDLIGIVNAKTSSSDVENIGYALPSNVVKYVVENIIYYKDSGDKTADVRKCMLGITITNSQSSAYLAEDGKVKIKEVVTVSSVQEEVTDGKGNVTQKAALAYGQLQSGDVLVSVKIHRKDTEASLDETYDVTRSFIIVDLMLTMRVGDTLYVTYDRVAEGTTSRGTAEFVMTEDCISEIG